MDQRWRRMPTPGRVGHEGANVACVLKRIAFHDHLMCRSLCRAFPPNLRKVCFCRKSCAPQGSQNRLSIGDVGPALCRLV